MLVYTILVYVPFARLTWFKLIAASVSNNMLSRLYVFILLTLIGVPSMADTLSWSTAAPEAVGLDADQLEAAWQNLAQRNTNAFLVVRRGQLVFERYSDKWSADKPHYTASLAKALVGGLSLGLALDDGLLKADDLAADFIPQWREDPQKSKITLRQLATHTAGIEDAELSAADRKAALQEGRTLTAHHMELPGWKGVFWRGTNEQYRIEGEADPFSVARDEAPVIFEPGTAFHYSNPGIALLTYCITSALRGTETPDVRTYLHERLFSRLGLRQGEDYSIGYGRTWVVDGLPLVASWGGGSFSARATARVGQMLVQEWRLGGPAADCAQYSSHDPGRCWYAGRRGCSGGRRPGGDDGLRLVVKRRWPLEEGARRRGYRCWGRRPDPVGCPQS